jgi:CubicO group peptidase (beta-lactamase class C family)
LDEILDAGRVRRGSSPDTALLPRLGNSISAFGDFAQQHLFDPAGMTNSRFLDVTGPPPVPGWASGRERVDIAFTCTGDGGLVTTLQDLARWDGWLTQSPLAELMLGSRPILPNGRSAHDAWGISVRSHPGLRIESHGGSIDGYMASFVRFPEAGISRIVLANTDQLGIEGFGGRARQLADSILRAQLDFTLPAWTETHGDPVVR